MGSVATGGWSELDLTAFVRGKTSFCLVLRPTSSDGLVFSSLQGDHRPRLLVETVPGP